MDFTYASYERLIKKIKEKNYKIVTYHDCRGHEKCIILRHDVDYDLSKAVEFAHFEYMCGGIKSTYFVLISSNFYNVLSKENAIRLQDILKYGHEIGLHFDEECYPEIIGNPPEICKKIIQEAELLSVVLGQPVTTVSMHRPSKAILEADLKVPGIINSYENFFFHNFKYISDSRRCWREPVEKIVEMECYEKLHILTHPFWYFDEERTIDETVKCFVNSANKQRYYQLNSNITDLNTIMNLEEVN